MRVDSRRGRGRECRARRVRETATPSSGHRAEREPTEAGNRLGSLATASRCARREASNAPQTLRARGEARDYFQFFLARGKAEAKPRRDCHARVAREPVREVRGWIRASRRRAPRTPSESDTTRNRAGKWRRPPRCDPARRSKVGTEDPGHPRLREAARSLRRWRLLCATCWSAWTALPRARLGRTTRPRTWWRRLGGPRASRLGRAPRRVRGVPVGSPGCASPPGGCARGKLSAAANAGRAKLFELIAWYLTGLDAEVVEPYAEAVMQCLRTFRLRNAGRRRR